MPAGDAITVTVVRPVGKDGFGDPLPGDPDEFDIPGCLFAPGPSTEQTFAANTVDSDAAIYAPPGPPATDVRPSDQVRVDGRLFQVVGDVQPWGSFGVVINLRRVTG